MLSSKYFLPQALLVVFRVRDETFINGFTTVKIISKAFDIDKSYLNTLFREMVKEKLILELHNPKSNLEKRYMITDYGKSHCERVFP